MQGVGGTLAAPKGHPHTYAHALRCQRTRLHLLLQVPAQPLRRLLHDAAVHGCGPGTHPAAEPSCPCGGGGNAMRSVRGVGSTPDFSGPGPIRPRSPAVPVEEESMR